jgi:hypothetical protein
VPSPAKSDFTFRKGLNPTGAAESQGGGPLLASGGFGVALDDHAVEVDLDCNSVRDCQGQ